MSVWTDAVRREVERFQRRTGASEFDLSEFLTQARPRVASQFPLSNTHEGSIREQLQNLVETGEIERITRGKYRVVAIDLGDLDLQSVTEEGAKILEQWQRVASTYSSGEFFDLEGLYDLPGLRTDLDRFIDSPSESTFTAFWDRLNSANRNGSGAKIYAKWTKTNGRTPEALAELVQAVRDADQYQENWEDQLGAKWTIRELYGQIHIDDTPSLNNKSMHGLELFGYPEPSSYAEAKTYFEDFKLDYIEICGHASTGTSHELPLNLEIDQLLRLIVEYSVDEPDLPDEPSEVSTLHDLIYSQRRMATPAMIGPRPHELGLGYVLKEITTRYPAPDELPENQSDKSVADYPRLQGWLKSEGVSVLEEAVSQTDLSYSLSSGMGQTTIAYDSFLAVFDENNSTSTKYGLYIVYLFDPAADEVYLTLNQGTAEAEQTARCAASGFDLTSALSQGAGMYRDEMEMPPGRFTFSQAELSNETDKAQNYNAATICQHRYTLSDLETEAEEEIVSDLHILIKGYQDLLSKCGSEPTLPLVDGDLWRIGPGEKGSLWPAWEKAEVASVGFGDVELATVRDADADERSSWLPHFGEAQLYQFTTNVDPGDMVIAGSDKDNLSRIYGIGIVTTGFDETDSAAVHDVLGEQHSTVHDRFVKVNWYPVAEEGLPITITTDDLAFHTWTVDTLTEAQAQLIWAAVCRKLSIINEDETPMSVSSDIRGQLDIGDKDTGPERPELPIIDDPVTAPYYWVNQSEGKAPIAGDYLQQAVDDRWSHNLAKLEVGDTVFNYHDQQLLGFSTIQSEAYVTEVDSGYRQRVDVEFHPFEQPIALRELYPIFIQDEYRLPKYNPMGPAGPNQEYLYCVSEAAGEKLLQMGSQQLNIERLEERLTLPSIEPTLPDGLYYLPEQSRSLRNQIRASINGGKHIVFTGPPGTGKSKLADHLCESLEANGIIDGSVFTTATAEWTAYDTVGGYMPSQNGHNGALEFSPGQFLRCFRTAEGDVKSDWLIIDELNRSNIDKAFGQLFSVLSGDSVELPYERESTVSIDWIDSDTDPDDRAEIATDPDRFPVTPQWRLIGTMNTADKTSLYEMSFAFMRRFSFIHVGIPDLTTSDGEVRAWLLDPNAATENFATAWLNIDPNAPAPASEQVEPENDALATTLENIDDRLAVLWANINTRHEIGPALIEDIASYVAAYETGEYGDALTNAVVSLVYPQLEGLRPDELSALIRSLNNPSRVVRADKRTTEASPATGPADEKAVQAKKDETAKQDSKAEQAESDRQVAPGVDIENVLKPTAENMFSIEISDEQDSS